MLDECLKNRIRDDCRPTKKVMIHLWAIRGGELHDMSSARLESRQTPDTDRSDLGCGFVKTVFGEGRQEEDDLRSDDDRRPSLTIAAAAAAAARACSGASVGG